MMKSVLAFFSALLVITNVSAKKSNMQDAQYVQGEVLVKFKGQKQLKSFLRKKSTSFALKRKLSVLSGEFAVLKVSQKLSLNKIIKVLNNDKTIEYAEPNFIYQVVRPTSGIVDILNRHEPITSFATNDPNFSSLWGLKNTGDNEPASGGGNSSPVGVAGIDINAIKAWGITKGSKNIKIAVIDTGVDYNHPDLENNIWTNLAEANGTQGVDDDGNGYIDDIHGYDFANKDGDPMDGNGHGTHCSGTIAAEHDNGIGIAGVMGDAQIVGVKFLTDAGSGSTADAIAAIDYATKIGVDIMSNSWGGGGYSQALKEAIERANEAGIIFTAAAGNSATNNDVSPHYPSNYDVENIISVAAINYNDELASFSCYGSSTVHVSAPGQNILSTVPNNSYNVFSGTSMATPHVTGVVGLYLSHNGTTDPKQLRDELMASSVYGSEYGRKTISGGRVDAYNFLNGIVTERPQRPDPSEWVSKSVESFESQHPYQNSKTISKTYSAPGARFMRVIVREHNLETNYDYLTIKNSKGDSVQRVDGKGQNTKSEFVIGDSITVEFYSDTSVSHWGFLIDEIEYIY